MKNDERKMKYSGIEWVGKIPNDWNKIYGQYLYDIVTGKKDVSQGDLDGQYPFFTCSDDVKRINEYSFDCEALLVAGNGIVGNAKYYNGKFDAYQRTYVLYNFKKERINIEFLKIYLSNLLTISVEAKTSGSVIEFIKLGDIKKFEIVYPDINRQERIAELLNKKIYNINSLIMNEEQQIEKLREYKQSLITEVVTKGLDKNVEMKDSGVEWIGETPKDWQVIKLKYIATSNDESIADSDIDDRVIKYVDIGSVSFENGVEHIEEIKLKDAPSRARRITMEGDLIVSTVRTYLKAIATINESNIIVSTGFCVIRNKSVIKNKFLEYICKSDFFTNMVSCQSIGVNYPSISSYQLMNLYIMMPEIKVQEKIVLFLNKRINKIEKMINTKKKKIEKLNEYKKSLIYEYVTGKKEV